MTTEYKTYAMFNTLTITGRILSSKVCTKDGEEFLAVEMVTAAFDGDETGMTVKFTSRNGLLALAKKDGLNAGRIITVTGHIKTVAETFTNKDGELQMLKRPAISLAEVSILSGGLGPVPKDQRKSAPRKVGAVVRPTDANKTGAPEVPSTDAAPVF